MKEKPLTNATGEVRELTQKDIHAMQPASKVLSKDLLSILPKRKTGQRGQQKAPTKILVTMRYSPKVIHYFKETGEGWQVRVNNVLEDWIKKHPHHVERHSSE